MKEPLPANEPKSIDWPRRCARLAMVAAVLCFLLQLAYAQLTAKDKAQRWTATDRVVAAVGVSLLLGGVLLSGLAFAGAVRTRNYDTGVIALIGLLINGGVLAFLAWYVLVIRPTLPLD